MNAPDKLREPWMAAAACQGHRTNLWFPLDHDPAGRLIINPTVVDLCARCPVRLDCLTYAVAHPTLEGIWAGTTPDDRRTLRSRHRIRAVPADHTPAPTESDAP